MGFQRAQWHSGLTYQQTCNTCKTVLQYTDYSLDFRPWYADGFVDCPKCKSHLRHNENYAIGRTEPAPQAAPAPEAPAYEEPVQEAPVQQPAYAVDLEDQAPAYEEPVQEAAAQQPAYTVDLAQQTGSAQALPVFCTSCGNKFGENDCFCARCGNKR